MSNELWCVRCEQYCKNRMDCASKPKEAAKIILEVAHVDLTRHGDVMLRRELAAIDNLNNWMD